MRINAKFVMKMIIEFLSGVIPNYCKCDYGYIENRFIIFDLSKCSKAISENATCLKCSDYVTKLFNLRIVRNPAIKFNINF